MVMFHAAELETDPAVHDPQTSAAHGEQLVAVELVTVLKSPMDFRCLSAFARKRLTIIDGCSCLFRIVTIIFTNKWLITGGYKDERS